MSINSDSYFWDLYSKKNSNYRNNFNLQFSNDFILNNFLKEKENSSKFLGIGEYNSNRFTLPMLASFLDYQDIISFKTVELTDYILMKKDKDYKIEKKVTCKKHFNAIMCCLYNNEEFDNNKINFIKTIFSLIFNVNKNNINNPDILNMKRLNNSSDLSLLCNYPYTFKIFLSDNATPIHIIVVKAMEEMDNLKENDFLLINNEIILYNKICEYIDTNDKKLSIVIDCPYNFILFTIISNIKKVNIDVNAQDDWGITIFYILAYYYNSFFNKREFGKALYILMNYLFILMDELGNMFGKTLIKTRATIFNKYNSKMNNSIEKKFIDYTTPFLLLVNTNNNNIPVEIIPFIKKLYKFLCEKIKIEGSNKNIVPEFIGGFTIQNITLSNTLKTKIKSIKNFNKKIKKIEKINKIKINIAIIGGGPVGLFFAIKLFNNEEIIKKYNINIDIYEKRSDYTRKQILLLQNNIINEIPIDIIEKFKQKGCYVVRPPLNKDGKCYLIPVDLSQFSIRTKTLESIFKKYIYENKFNINFLNETVNNDNIDEIINNHNILISASGGNDPLPNKINTIYIEEPLSYGIVFNFNVKYYENFANKNNINLRNEQQQQHLFRGFRTQKDTFYIGIQINKNNYDKINEEINKDEFKNKNNKQKFDLLPKNIKHIFYKALTYYKMNKQIIFDSIEFSIFPIIKKQTQKSAGIYNNKKIYLIGDSLSTTHFFSGQGVNIGFKSAIELIKILFNENSIDKYNTIGNNLKSDLTYFSKLVTKKNNEMTNNNYEIINNI
jgi:hypothetical protein